MKNSSILGANDEYVQQAALYGRKDALLALVLYIAAFNQFLLLGKIFVLKGSSLTGSFTFLATGTVSLICIVLVFLICFIQKQKLVTVGFSKKQAKKSLARILRSGFLKRYLKALKCRNTIRYVLQTAFWFQQNR